MLIIKFLKTEQDAQSLATGKIRMMASEHYRKIDNNYRGDKYDGVMQIEDGTVSLGVLRNGKAIGDIANVRNISISNTNAQKKPMYCFSMLTEKVLNKSKNIFYLTDSFYDEMKKFGNYFAILHGEEVEAKIYQRAEELKLYGLFKEVSYINTIKKHTSEYINKPDSWFWAFFNKSLSYEKQNEIRLVLFPQKITQELIENEEAVYWFNVGKFNLAIISRI